MRKKKPRFSVRPLLLWCVIFLSVLWINYSRTQIPSIPPEYQSDIECYLERIDSLSGFRGVMGRCWVVDTEGNRYRYSGPIIVQNKKIPKGILLHLKTETTNGEQWISYLEAENIIYYSVDEFYTDIRECISDAKIVRYGSIIFFALSSAIVLAYYLYSVYKHLSQKRSKKE